MLHSNAGTQFGAVESGFCGENIAFSERVVPTRIQTRRFVRGETDAVSQVVGELSTSVAVQARKNFLVEFLATYARSDVLFYEL